MVVSALSAWSPNARPTTGQEWRCPESRGIPENRVQNGRRRGLEPKVRIELTAYALPRRCSTTELLGQAPPMVTRRPLAIRSVATLTGDREDRARHREKGERPGGPCHGDRHQPQISTATPRNSNAPACPSGNASASASTPAMARVAGPTHRDDADSVTTGRLRRRRADRHRYRVARWRGRPPAINDSGMRTSNRAGIAPPTYAAMGSTAIHPTTAPTRGRFGAAPDRRRDRRQGRPRRETEGRGLMVAATPSPITPRTAPIQAAADRPSTPRTSGSTAGRPRPQARRPRR